MTSLLVRQARKVIAIEIDRDLVRILREEFRENPKVEIISADVLSVDFTSLCGWEGVSPAFVFGNLPYYITSPILHHLFAHRVSIRAMGLLMQREVAERLTAGPGGRDYGYLSVATQIYSQPQIALDVPPGAFSPAPQVQSALVTFQVRPRFEHWPASKHEEFLEFAKHCFAQKRKNLLNNLAWRYSRGRITEALQKSGKPANARAEQLAIEDLAALFDFLNEAD